MRTLYLSPVMALLLTLGTATLANALIIDQVTPSGSFGTTNPIGQSLHTPAAGGPWDNLTFNFFHRTFPPPDYLVAYLPYAFGDLYLLDQEYLGTTASLSSATPGYVAHTGNIVAEGTGSEWVFDSTLQLDQDTDYWFYMSSDRGEGILLNGVANSLNPGFYSTDPVPTSAYSHSSGHDAAFELEGTVIPEPSTGVLVGFALLGLLAARHGKAGR